MLGHMACWCVWCHMRPLLRIQHWVRLSLLHCPFRHFLERISRNIIVFNDFGSESRLLQTLDSFLQSFQTPSVLVFSLNQTTKNMGIDSFAGTPTCCLIVFCLLRFWFCFQKATVKMLEFNHFITFSRINDYLVTLICNYLVVFLIIWYLVNVDELLKWRSLEIWTIIFPNLITFEAVTYQIRRGRTSQACRFSIRIRLFF